LVIPSPLVLPYIFRAGQQKYYQISAGFIGMPQRTLTAWLCPPACSSSAKKKKIKLRRENFMTGDKISKIYSSTKTLQKYKYLNLNAFSGVSILNKLLIQFTGGKEVRRPVKDDTSVSLSSLADEWQLSGFLLYSPSFYRQ
jgi:hypothetical protein